ncbi:MAG: DUF58 domain-containing protein [Pseudomonadota bacterium]
MSSAAARREEVINPATLAAIDDLELAGRMLATGYLFGRHLGQRHGPGFEFAQYRAWQPGDSSRSVDWRLYARSERLSVRESELETDQRLWLLLDTSASMDFASPGGALNKFAYACRLAAALGYLAQQQGDELGLITLASDCRLRVPASAGRLQWYRVLGAMRDLRCAGSLGDVSSIDGNPTELRLPQGFSDASEGALIIVLSDFYQHHGELSDLLGRLANGGRDVRAVCLETEAERTLPYRGVVRLRDPESGVERFTDPAQTRAAYRASRQSYFDELRRTLLGRGVNFERFNVDEPLDGRLRRYLTDQP